jgi:hypothetical protein
MKSKKLTFIKVAITICNLIAAMTLYITSSLFLSWLLEQKPHKVWMEYILYFGMGVLLYFPIKKITKHE